MVGIVLPARRPRCGRRRGGRDSGDLGHPLVFSAAAFPELRELHGDKAVRKLIERRPERVERIHVDRELPRGVDTWDDYEAALSVVRAVG